MKRYNDNKDKVLVICFKDKQKRVIVNHFKSLKLIASEFAYKILSNDRFLTFSDVQEKIELYFDDYVVDDENSFQAIPLSKKVNVVIIEFSECD